MRAGAASPPADIMQPIEILLVEDNPGDVRLAVEVLKDGKFVNHLSVVERWSLGAPVSAPGGKISRLRCALTWFCST